MSVPGGSSAASSDAILLGGYAAKQCPVRVQNDFLPLAPTLKWQPTAEEQTRLDAGILFESKAFGQLAALHPESVVIDSQLGKSEAIAATAAAMEAGMPLILGGWLPDDPDGGRTGKPDILIAVDGGGYLPADVKHHRTVKPARTTRIAVSSVATPALQISITGWTPTPHRYDDGLQLAHYTRMLEACGHHPGPEHRWGAVLGTSRIELTPGAEAEPVFVWHELAQAIGYTFSRSQGRASRSSMERYDHEHRFRVEVAATARRIAGGTDDPDPLVQPVGQKECGSCPYGSRCAEQMGPDDPSTAINVGRLSPREWLTLRRMGIGTTAALSAVDVDDPLFFEDYFAEVAHLGRGQARKRLAGAVERAQMICAGIVLARTGEGPLAGAAADVEIDVDIEFDADGVVYLWGARVRHRGDDSTAHYVSDFVEWGRLDGPAERDLAARFAAWLRVDDPGGERSQLHLARVRADPNTDEASAARRWLLTYNEDDNAAMARIRDGMREWGGAEPPRP